MGLEISRCVSEAVHAEAAASLQLEVCGLLFGTPDLVTAYASCRNVAANPAVAFEIDPAALIAAYRAARNGGPAIVGCYHSHPLGPPTPSVRDAAAAEPNGWLWLIIGSGSALCWRAVADGAHHGRFDAVPFELYPDGPR